MKKGLILLFMLAMVIILQACANDISGVVEMSDTLKTDSEIEDNGDSVFEDHGVDDTIEATDTLPSEHETDDNARGVAQESSGKVAIITLGNTEFEEIHSAQAMVEKHPGKVIHEVLPDDWWEEPDSIKTVVEKIAANQEVKALIVTSAVRGTNSAIEQLRKSREDILVIYGYIAEELNESARMADVVLNRDFMKINYDIVRLAYEAGARTFVHYAIEHHMSAPLLSARHDIFKYEAERLGMEFVFVELSNPFSFTSHEFILEDVPRKVYQYGKDTAFFGNTCAMQAGLIRACLEEAAIFPLPCCPSPFHGFPVAFELDGFHLEVTKGVTRARFDDPRHMVNRCFIQTTIEQINKKVVDAGMGGRFSTWRYASGMLKTFVAVDYAFRWMVGETNGRVDIDVLVELIESYTGPEADISLLEEDGVVYENYILYTQPYIVFQ